MSFTHTVRLIQHTPIIQFQHTQAGASLRATELKPKLDRFLMREISKKTSPEEIKKFFLEQHKSWLVGLGQGDEKHLALNYKMSILAQNPKIETIQKGDREIPLFFANMGDDYVERGLVSHSNITLRIQCLDTELLKKIIAYLGAFFAQHNFGMRSGKGFGSFSIEGDSTLPKNARWFDIATENWKTAFQKIELFYKSVRGGINGAKGEKGFVREFYMKPLIFSYAKQQGIKWEKKIIKEKRLGSSLKSQQANHAHKISSKAQPEWPLWDDGNQEFIVRDLLGLSSEQTWKGYPGGRNGASITKEDSYGKIDRFASPLVFKPMKLNNGKFRIYFWGEPIPEEYFKTSFDIKVNDSSIGKYGMWKGFDLQGFIHNHLTVANAKAAMQYSANDRRQQEIADTLLAIYTDIQKNRT